MRTKYKMTKEERAVRLKARWKIVWAARVHVTRMGLVGTHTTMQHLQRCVRICRQHKLLGSDVYKEAGFNGCNR